MKKIRELKKKKEDTTQDPFVSISNTTFADKTENNKYNTWRIGFKVDIFVWTGCKKPAKC